MGQFGWLLEWTMPHMTEPRARINHLQVIVNSEERKAIQQRAAAANLSVSAYLRTVGLHRTIRTTVDRRAIEMLSKVNADQGRLGGLLKLWLTDQPGRGVAAKDVREVLSEIQALQGQLSESAAKL